MKTFSVLWISKLSKNVWMKTASIVLWWGALLICQSKTLWRTSGWPQPTLLIQETIYRMSLESVAIDGRGASAVTVNLPAVCRSSRDPPYVWIFSSFLLKYLHDTDRNAEQAAAMVQKTGSRLLNSHIFLRGPQASLCPFIWFHHNHQWGRKRGGCHVVHWSHDFRCWLDRSSPHMVH